MVATRVCLRVAFLIGLSIMLGGCMQALQKSERLAITPMSSPIVSTPEISPEMVSSGQTYSPQPVPSFVQNLETPTNALEINSAVPLLPTQTPTLLPKAIEETPYGVSTSPIIFSPTPTSTKTSPSSPTFTPTPAITIAPPTLPALSHEQRWRSQQIARTVFETLRPYRTSGSELWWFDPVNQQHVVLGSFSGDFVAQAQFTLAGTRQVALEVPYQVNKSYGLTAISSALVQRIQKAVSGEWIEAYVLVTPHVQP